jgi:hypothetical protein
MFITTDPQAILSAMITPAVLISACGSLIIATVGRLNRAVDRTREVSAAFATLAAKVGRDAVVSEEDDAELAILFSQLDINTSRARFLQRALARTYWALGMFVATSVAIGIVAVTGIKYAVVPITLGLAGAALLLYASLLMVHESRLALMVLEDEMDFLWARSRMRATPELLDRYKPPWKLFRRKDTKLDG